MSLPRDDPVVAEARDCPLIRAVCREVTFLNLESNRVSWHMLLRAP